MDSTIGSRSLRWILATPTGEGDLELEVRYCVGVVKALVCPKPITVPVLTLPAPDLLAYDRLLAGVR